MMKSSDNRLSNMKIRPQIERFHFSFLEQNTDVIACLEMLRGKLTVSLTSMWRGAVIKTASVRNPERKRLRLKKKGYKKTMVLYLVIF